MCEPLKERHTISFRENDFKGIFSMSTIIYFLSSASNCCCHYGKQCIKLAMPLTHIHVLQQKAGSQYDAGGASIMSVMDIAEERIFSLVKFNS